MASVRRVRPRGPGFASAAVVRGAQAVACAFCKECGMQGIDRNDAGGFHLQDAWSTLPLLPAAPGRPPQLSGAGPAAAPARPPEWPSARQDTHRQGPGRLAPRQPLPVQLVERLLAAPPREQMTAEILRKALTQIVEARATLGDSPTITSISNSFDPPIHSSLLQSWVNRWGKLKKPRASLEKLPGYDMHRAQLDHLLAQLASPLSVSSDVPPNGADSRPPSSRAAPRHPWPRRHLPFCRKASSVCHRFLRTFGSGRAGRSCRWTRGGQLSAGEAAKRHPPVGPCPCNTMSGRSTARRQAAARKVHPSLIGGRSPCAIPARPGTTWSRPRRSPANTRKLPATRPMGGRTRRPWRSIPISTISSMQCSIPPIHRSYRKKRESSQEMRS